MTKNVVMIPTTAKTTVLRRGEWRFCSGTRVISHDKGIDAPNIFDYEGAEFGGDLLPTELLEDWEGQCETGQNHGAHVQFMPVAMSVLRMFSL